MLLQLPEALGVGKPQHALMHLTTSSTHHSCLTRARNNHFHLRSFNDSLLSAFVQSNRQIGEFSEISGR